MRIRDYEYNKENSLEEKLKFYFEYQYGIYKNMEESEVFQSLEQIINNHKDMKDIKFIITMNEVVRFCSKKCGEESKINITTIVDNFVKIFNIMKKEVEEYRKLKTKTKRRKQ